MSIAMQPIKHPSAAVPPDIYDTRYYLHSRGGSDEFVKSKGRILCDSHAFALRLADLKASDFVLDAGCGCGEIAMNAAPKVHSVTAFDYSGDAIALAKDAIQQCPPALQQRVAFFKADVGSFVFPENHYDVIFFIDVIEHLTSEQIETLLLRMASSLKPGGRLIVHTWPNRWHTEYSYPLSYYAGMISGKKRPKSPRKAHDDVMHVSEQSPLELKRRLRKAGFMATIMMRHPPSSQEGLLYRFIHTAPIFKYLFCDHIWALAKKTG